MLRRKFVNILIPLFLLFIIVLLILFFNGSSTNVIVFTLTPTNTSIPIQITKTLVPTIQIEIQSFGIVEVDNLNLRECPGIDCKVLELIVK